MRGIGSSILASFAILMCLTDRSVAAEPAQFDEAAGPFLQKYCLRCHNEKKQEGEFRLDTLSHDFTEVETAKQWDEVIFRMNSGEMPPEDEAQPSPEELGSIVDWLSARSREGQAARMARRGPVAHYRLSRNEYQNTIYDLLGVYYNVNRPGVFNPDPLWHGFDHIGSMLTLSPSHVDNYMDAAQEILAGANLNKPVRYKQVRKEAIDLNRFEDVSLSNFKRNLRSWVMKILCAT